MMSDPAAACGPLGNEASHSLRELAAQKEKEWREVQDLRLHSLENAYKEKEQQHEEEKARFHKLKEDFKYNLKLLEDRDLELEKYDSYTAELKSQINNKTAEGSELRIQVAELEQSVVRETQAQGALQQHYQQRLREHQAQLNQYKSVKEAEVKKERVEFERLKRSLQQQVKEIQSELETQRLELSTGYEEAMRRRENEYRSQGDEMSATVLAHELKVKLLSKELELMKGTQEKTAEQFHTVDENHRELEKKLKEKDWELADTRGMKDAQIKDLENKIKQQELTMKRTQEDFQRKHSELDRFAREKEAALAQAREAMVDSERALQQSIYDLQAKLEGAATQIRQLQWAGHDLKKDKEGQVEKLQSAMVDLKSQWDRQIAETSRETVARDLQLQALQESEGKLREEIEGRKRDIDRYKRELTLATEREANLEQRCAQLEIDWQRRYEDTEREQFSKSEELVKNLTRARDEAVASVKEKGRELEQERHVVQVLRQDCDQALATLKQHGLMVDTTIEMSKFKDGSASAAEEIEELQKQNDNLRNVIRMMREEMENLSKQQMPTNSKPTESRSSVVEGYVKNLEDELKELKSRQRDLEHELGDGRLRAPQPKPKPAVDPPPELSDNALVRSHIDSLNNNIASLRSEKVELSAQAKKQQVRIVYLENMVDQLSKQPRQKQVEIDQLQYELGAATRRYQAEVASLRQRVAEMELHLVESRKEADEYYKGTLERNMENMALGNELSSLKVDMAQRNPAINFGAQELLIQQLKDEIQRLRQQLTGKGHVPWDQPITGGVANNNNSATTNQLHMKLRSAARMIKQLATEKQQLIENGNRLRAEILKNGLKVPSPSRLAPQLPNQSLPPKPHGSLSQKVQDKLTQLEKLQYQLTKQELVQGQRGRGMDVPIEVRVGSSSETDNDADQHRPPSILKKHPNNFSARPSHSSKVSGVVTAGPHAQYQYRPKSATNIQRPLDETPEHERPGTAGSAREWLGDSQPGFGATDHVPGQGTVGREPWTDTQQRPGTAQSGKSTRTASPTKDLHLTMSSVGGESLQDVWRLLDDGQSPTLITPRDDYTGAFTEDWARGVNTFPEQDSSVDTVGLVVEGNPAQAGIKPVPEARQLSQKALGRVPKKSAPSKAKIRNWNVREDGR